MYLRISICGTHADTYTTEYGGHRHMGLEAVVFCDPYCKQITSF